VRQGDNFTHALGFICALYRGDRVTLLDRSPGVRCGIRDSDRFA